MEIVYFRSSKHIALKVCNELKDFLVGTCNLQGRVHYWNSLLRMYMYRHHMFLIRSWPCVTQPQGQRVEVEAVVRVTLNYWAWAGALRGIT
jgi:hypothetical protein